MCVFLGTTPRTDGLDHNSIISELRGSLASAEARLLDMETEHQRTISNLNARIHNAEVEHQRTLADLKVQLQCAEEIHQRNTETAPATEVDELQGDDKEESASVSS